MGLTVTRDMTNIGSKQMAVGTVAFDSSYLWGGESFDCDQLFGIHAVDNVFIENKHGCSFHYDHTNKTMKAYRSAPPIIYDELHTAVANVITLNYPAAWIINVAKTGTNANQALVSSGATLAANQCQLSAAPAWGTLTSLKTYGATDAVYVSYVTQAWKDIFDLLVFEEALTLATGANATVYDILGFGYCYDATTGLLPPQSKTTAAGSGRVRLTFSTKASSLGANAAQNTHAAVVTYLKQPASGYLVDRIVNEVGVKTGGGPYINTFTHPLLLWLQTGAMLLDNAAPQALVPLSNTPAGGFVSINWGYRGSDTTGTAATSGSFQVAGGSNVTADYCQYLTGHPWEIPTVPIQAPSGIDLTGIGTVNFIVIGT